MWVWGLLLFGLLQSPFALCMTSKVDAITQERAGGEEHARLHYWELLMMDARGKKVEAPRCSPTEAQCTTIVLDPKAPPSKECCDGGCSNVRGAANPTCCYRNEDPASAAICVSGSAATKCCGGFCENRPGGLLCFCFSGDTLVRVRDSASQGDGRLVAMRDVKTGQYIRCLDSDEDLRIPTTLSWCEAVNWHHAEEATFKQHKISFVRPHGQQGSLTLSSTHQVLKLTEAAVEADRTVTNVESFGAFVTVAAVSVQPGDVLAVLADESNPELGFAAVAVSSVDVVEASGAYLPALEKPYIIANGVVTPMRVIPPQFVSAPEDMHGARHAAQHYQFAPNFMTRVQPKGTPGREGAWDNGNPIWPGAALIQAAKAARIAAGDALDYKALHAWFMPRYKAWKADPSQAITVEDVVTLLKSDDIWIKAPAGGFKHSKREAWLVSEYEPVIEA